MKLIVGGFLSVCETNGVLDTDITRLFGNRVWFHGRQFSTHFGGGGGWFGDDLSTFIVDFISTIIT